MLRVTIVLCHSSAVRLSGDVPRPWVKHAACICCMPVQAAPGLATLQGGTVQAYNASKGAEALEAACSVRPTDCCLSVVALVHA
jgi:hypothetical protein